MIQYDILKRSPRLLRWYRTRITLDWHRLQSHLPVEGTLLDVGCGVGSVDYEIARCSPALKILGIDTDTQSIAMAQSYHALPNVEYGCANLQSVETRFDCILLIDVLHHVPPHEHDGLLEACANLLTEQGYLLIKDIERRGGQISWFMDRYISGAEKVYLFNCGEMVRQVAQHLKVTSSEARFRLPFPHYYITAQRASG